MSQVIRVYQRELHVHTLGPGDRYCLWVQGCKRRCPGCISPASRMKDAGYEMPAGALAAEIAYSGAEGVTLSGGEPFLQAGALAEMLRQLREVYHKDLGVVAYTGYLLEELRQMDAAKALLDRVDLLIDGPYVQALDDGKSLRGSSNQRVIPLTSRYNVPEVLNLYGDDARPVEYFWHGSGVSQVGVPGHVNPKDLYTKHFPVTPKKNEENES